VSSFVLLVPAAAILCIVHKGFAAAGSNEQADEKSSYETRLRSAFQRYIKARDTEQDRRLLSSYFGKLEDEVNSSYHVFISCELPVDSRFFSKLNGLRLKAD